MDITDKDGRRAIRAFGPDAVIHCAAKGTAADAAEQEYGMAQEGHRRGTRNIAEVCRDSDIKIADAYTQHRLRLNEWNVRFWTWKGFPGNAAQFMCWRGELTLANFLINISLSGSYAAFGRQREEFYQDHAAAPGQEKYRCLAGMIKSVLRPIRPGQIISG